MALLMRFDDPQKGRITVNDHDLRSVRQSSLRRNIGVVLQDPLLFNDTVRTNIAYGRPEATDEEIAAAARAAHAHGFIERLPDQYDSMAGERGSALSVGERQRITIARALLKDPRVLVFDEATSALDAESEEAVQKAFENLKKQRTTFIIAHRLATVVRADRIIVLKDGLIAESGTHALADDGRRLLRFARQAAEPRTDRERRRSICAAGWNRIHRLFLAGSKRQRVNSGAIVRRSCSWQPL